MKYANYNKKNILKPGIIMLFLLSFFIGFFVIDTIVDMNHVKAGGVCTASNVDYTNSSVTVSWNSAPALFVTDETHDTYTNSTTVTGSCSFNKYIVDINGHNLSTTNVNIDATSYANKPGNNTYSVKAYYVCSGSSVGSSYTSSPQTGSFYVYAPSASIYTISGSDNIEYGQSSTIYWGSNNASSCSIYSNDRGFVNGAVSVSGHRTITPHYYDTSKNYFVSCSGLGGNITSAPLVIHTNVSCQIDKKFNRVLSGQYNEINWSCTNSPGPVYNNSCIVKDSHNNTLSRTNKIGDTSYYKVRETDNSTVYTLKCMNSDGGLVNKGTTNTSIINVPNIHEVVPGF